MVPDLALDALEHDVVSVRLSRTPERVLDRELAALGKKESSMRIARRGASVAVHLVGGLRADVVALVEGDPIGDDGDSLVLGTLGRLLTESAPVRAASPGADVATTPVVRRDAWTCACRG